MARALLMLGGSLVLIGAWGWWLASGRQAWRRFISRLVGPDPELEARIRPPVPRFEGFDPELRERTRIRRERIERARFEAGLAAELEHEGRAGGRRTGERREFAVRAGGRR